MADRDSTTTAAITTAAIKAAATATGSAPETGAPSASQAGGFAVVARRISGWTANLLATGIVIVACLAIGRQTIAWWYESPASVASNESGALPESLPQELRLLTRHGSLTVEQVRGDRKDALAALRKRCAEEAAASDWSAPLQEEEQRFLEKLANSPPIEQTGGFDLHQPPGEWTMVVAVHREARRIAAWSFAFPADESMWSCYTVRPAEVVRPAEIAPPGN